MVTNIHTALLNKGGLSNRVLELKKATYNMIVKTQRVFTEGASPSDQPPSP